MGEGCQAEQGQPISVGLFKTIQSVAVSEVTPQEWGWDEVGWGWGLVLKILIPMP